MCRENGRVFQILSAAVCAIIFLAAGSSASANDFGVYGQYSVPDVNGLAAIGGYIKDIGVPMTWGDEFQYVYLLDSQMNAYKVEVRIRNDGGVDDPTTYIDPLQHPDLLGSSVPIEPRTVTLKIGPKKLENVDKRMYTRGEFHVDSRGVFLGPSAGIVRFDHDLEHMVLIAPEIHQGVSLAYNPDKEIWYTGSNSEGTNRQIYRLCDTNHNESYMDESWQPIFVHSDYGGERHGGLEYVSGYLWISDKKSDILARWQYDSATDTWSEARRYTYSEPADVVGLGFGPNNSFWISAAGTAPNNPGGTDNYGYYEVGANMYPVAIARVNMLFGPPIIPFVFKAGYSYHPDDPFHKIVMYEWDFDDTNNDVYDVLVDCPDPLVNCPTVEHAYPAVLTDLSDPYSIDWEATSKCYEVKLRVTDDMQNTDVDRIIVCVTPPPWDPVADAGETYAVRVNEVLCLDGSASFDPAQDIGPDHPWYEKIESWEWDLDGDGIFGEEGETGEKPCWSWSTEGPHDVTLRVTDTGGTTAEDKTVVVVHAIHDVAVTEVTPSKITDIHECDVIPIDVNILNLGDYDEQNFSVKISCDGVEFDQAIVNSLAIGETKTLSFLWDTTGVSAGLHKIRACADVVPGEIRIADNCLTTVVEVDHIRTLTVSSGDNGSVTVPGEGEFLYEDGTTVPVEATPDDHYHFLEWTGTAVDAGKVASQDAITAVTVEGSCSLTLKANFAIDTHTLTTCSTFGGSVTTPGEETKEYDYGEVVNLEATATEDGFEFGGWEGPVRDASSEKTDVKIETDTTVKAIFVKRATSSDTVDSSDGQDNTYFLPPGIDDDDIWRAESGKYYRGYFRDWIWTHTFSPPEGSIYSINSAQLKILAFDVDTHEVNYVYGDDVLLGSLDPNDDRWNETTIDLNAEALEKLTDGTMVIRIDISTEDTERLEDQTHWKMAIKSSALIVDYKVVTEGN